MFRVRRSPGEFIADGFASSSNSTSRRERGGAEEEESGRPSVQATSSRRLRACDSSSRFRARIVETMASTRIHAGFAPRSARGESRNRPVSAAARPCLAPITRLRDSTQVPTRARIDINGGVGIFGDSHLCARALAWSCRFVFRKSYVNEQLITSCMEFRATSKYISIQKCRGTISPRYFRSTPIPHRTQQSEHSNERRQIQDSHGGLRPPSSRRFGARDR